MIRRPSASEQADIAFGWNLAKEMGRLDVGQAVAVKERSVLAVEAIEGTDQAIARAGGFTEWASRDDITLIRIENGVEKRIKINYKDFVKGKSTENPELKGNDTIVVR